MKWIYKGLQFTKATSTEGAVSMTVYDTATNTYVFNSGICRDRKQLLMMILKTRNYYNELLEELQKNVRNN
jgi:hypothetical protein